MDSGIPQVGGDEGQQGPQRGGGGGGGPRRRCICTARACGHAQPRGAAAPLRAPCLGGGLLAGPLRAPLMHAAPPPPAAQDCAYFAGNKCLTNETYPGLWELPLLATQSASESGLPAAAVQGGRARHEQAAALVRRPQRLSPCRCVRCVCCLLSSP